MAVTELSRAFRAKIYTVWAMAFSIGAAAYVLHVAWLYAAAAAVAVVAIVYMHLSARKAGVSLWRLIIDLLVMVP